MKRQLCYILLLLLSSTSWTQAQVLHNDRKPINPSSVRANRGMAVTSHPLATQAALDILKLGGNAVDAAIAANAVLGVVQPSTAGLGGDLMALIWDNRSQRLLALNGSGRIPQKLSMDFFRKQKIRQIPETGPLSISMPGCADAWFEMHAKFGKLSPEEILAPAISYAAEGFPVDEKTAAEWLEGLADRKMIPGFKETFLPLGNAPSNGDIFKNEQLAQTYRQLSEAGFQSFYQGSMATQIISGLQSLGNPVDSSDFMRKHSHWTRPIGTSYHGYEVWQMPYNSLGFMVVDMLNMLEYKDLKSNGFLKKEHLHWFTEAKKQVWQHRDNWLVVAAESGDLPDFVLSKEAAELPALKLSADKASGSKTVEWIHEEALVFISVADKNGQMVTLVQGLYGNWGSGVVPAGLGFVLQNRAASCSLLPAKPNTLIGGDRPVVNMLPTFVTKDGRPWLSMGLPDGDLQVQGLVQMLINLIDFEQRLPEAALNISFLHESASLPANGDDNDPGWLVLQAGFNYETTRELMKLGHRIRYDNAMQGHVKAILRDLQSGVYDGISGPGNSGQAAGY